jgi:hypothetical protein
MEPINYITEDPLILAQRYLTVSFCRTESSRLAIKFRGAFPTVEDAEKHCKMLQNLDRNSFDIAIGETGKWITLDMNEKHFFLRGEREETNNEVLNEILKGHSQNEERIKEAFEERKANSMKEMKAFGTAKGQKYMRSRAYKESVITELEKTLAFHRKELEELPEDTEDDLKEFGYFTNKEYLNEATGSQ